MRNSFVALAALAALVLLTACGKVGAPLPPIIRIPQKVVNLSAAQSGYNVVLTWTNPDKYIDNTGATDLGVVHVFRNGAEIQTVMAGKAGQPQSLPLDARGSIGSSLKFTIQMIVSKRKPSAISNEAMIQLVDVPGAPRNVRVLVDQDRITLTWDEPEKHPELADGYIIQRADRPAVSRIRGTAFSDGDYEASKHYSYTVTAVRGTNPQISGDGDASIGFDAVDKTPPTIPTGLQVQEITEQRALITWNANGEADLKGYELFRSDSTEPIATPAGAGFPDPTYMSGLSYRVLAVDKSGNKSDLSAPQKAPDR